MRSNAPSGSVGSTSRLSPSIRRSASRVRNPPEACALVPVMNVIRLTASVACCAAFLTAPASAGAAELPLSGTLDLASEGDGRITGPVFGSRAGWTVADAGDFNGDGVHDLLI